MVIKRWIKISRYFVGVLIFGSIIYSYIGVIFISLLFLDYYIIYYIALLIGIGMFLLGITLFIAISIISRRLAGKKIFAFKKDSIVGVLGIGLGAVGSICMLIGIFIYVFSRYMFIPNIIWPILAIFGAGIYFLEEREYSGFFLVIASLGEFLVVFVIFRAWLYAGWVTEFVLILFGGLLTLIGGILILLGDFLHLKKRIE